MLRKIAVAFAAVLLIALVSPAHAEQVRLSANLDGVSEVPSVESPARPPPPCCSTRTPAWSAGTSIGPASPATPTAAHFHGPASKHNKAGVQVDLGGNGFVSPFRGTAQLTDEQAGQLLDGQWYINIHTAAHPDGEIRGQVLRQP